ncbi:MAG: guanylate kinase [Lentimicrobium sp.]|nr:guanylate kinase [Lentimicrobium sp.]
MVEKNKGRLIVVSAPSGAGKTTLVKHLLSAGLNLGFSVSATSRAQRKGEVHGKDYFFITGEEFLQHIEDSDLLEWQEVYSGSYYGTLKSEVDNLLNAGKNVIFDVDVIGGLNIKKVFGDSALAIFISPPSIEALEMRLKNRSTDSPETIAKRMEKALTEMAFAPHFDVIVINDNLEEAKQNIYDLVSQFFNAS